jgi:hypothetical protein
MKVCLSWGLLFFDYGFMRTKPGKLIAVSSRRLNK